MNMDIQAALEVADETDAYLQISDLIFEKGQNQGFDALTYSEKTFYCIDGFLREMGNGGLAHFFYNESGSHAGDTIQALDQIKVPSAKEIVVKALECFPDKQVPQDNEDRIQEFGRIEENYAELIGRLDDQFYTTESEVVKKTLKYVADNLKDFS